MRRLKVLALPLLLSMHSSIAFAAQPGTKIPTQEIEADVSPFKLFLVHNSFCEFRTEFSHSEFGVGSFIFDLNPKRPYTSPQVYLEKDASLGAESPQLSLYLMDVDNVVVRWDLDARVKDLAKYYPEVKLRFLYQSFSFVEGMTIEIPKSDGLTVTIDEQVIFQTKFPRGGAHFMEELKKCTAAKEAARQADSK